MVFGGETVCEGKFELNPPWDYYYYYYYFSFEGESWLKGWCCQESQLIFIFRFFAIYLVENKHGVKDDGLVGGTI